MRDVVVSPGLPKKWVKVPPESASWAFGLDRFLLVGAAEAPEVPTSCWR